MEKFLLNNAPTSSHDVAIGHGHVVITQHIQFDLGTYQEEVVAFLHHVKQDSSVRHTYTGGAYILEYEPQRNLDELTITRRSSGRTITMTLSTAYRLLDALTGNTEKLVREE